MTIDLPPKVVAAIDECSKHWGSPTVARRHLSEIARLAIEEALQPEGRPSEEVYRKAERYHWLRGATSEWSALFSEPPKWDGGSWVRLGSRWTGAKLDEVIDAQMGSEPQRERTPE
jgi:hypothetical protein